MDLFDLSKFPRKTSGFYIFTNVDTLNQAIPDPFCSRVTTNDVFHNSLVCLDLVVLLIKDAGAKAPRLREGFASKCFAWDDDLGTAQEPNYVIKPVTSYSFYRNGRTLLYPTNGYIWITGLARSGAEEDLAVSLMGRRLFPGRFEDTDEAVKSLFATWNELRRKDGLTFPQKIKVVSCGYIPMKYKYWAIDHMGIYMENKGRLVYLEKNGPRGPFMRVDFQSKEDLGKFVANKLLPDSRDPKEMNYQAPIFVSVNDELIYIARP